MLLTTLLFACIAPGGPNDTGVSPFQTQAEIDATPSSIESTPCASCDGECVVEHVVTEERYHTAEDIDYPDRPPVGGPHGFCWLARGIYDDPPPEERFVHNLEHGNVVVAYNCPDGCAAEVAELTAFVQSHDLTLLVNYPEMEERFAVLAWQYRLLLDCVDIAQIELFYEQHVDQGVEGDMGAPPSACL